MWELGHKEGWVLKNWCFWCLVLEKTLEGPLDCKEIKLVNPKGNQFWIFIGRTDAEAEAPVLRPPDAKSQLTGEDMDTGTDWRQKEKRVAEDEWFYTVPDSMDMNLSKPQQMVKEKETWLVLQSIGPESWIQLSDWTTRATKPKVLVPHSWAGPTPSQVCTLLLVLAASSLAKSSAEARGAGGGTPCGLPVHWSGLDKLARALDSFQSVVLPWDWESACLSSGSLWAESWFLTGLIIPICL